MKIQVEVEDRVISEIEQLRAVTGSADFKELFNNALALLSWATTQRLSGRAVASIDERLKEFRRLRMPALEFAASIGGDRYSESDAA